MAMTPTFNTPQCRWMADRYREGYPIAEIAAAVGCHRETANRCIIRVGAKAGPGEIRPSLKERMAEFHALAGDPPERESCKVCGHQYPKYRVYGKDNVPLGCEQCLTIRQWGVIQI